MFVTGFRTAARRREAGLSAPSLGGLCPARRRHRPSCWKLIVFYLNQARGMPWMFGLFVGLVVAMNYALTRTKWGRSMTAVGGNREAARRAGINVRLIYTSAFVLCSMLAALGGVLAAARLASASQQAGTGDVNLNAIAAAVIGGTSLFGGRGSAYSALLGIIVIQSIASGLTLARSVIVASLHDHRRASLPSPSSSTRWRAARGFPTAAPERNSNRQRIANGSGSVRKSRGHHRRRVGHRPRMRQELAERGRPRRARRPRRGEP